MKKIMSVLMMGCMGLFATLSWAGTAREDTVERFHSSVEVLHAIMEAPDKGVPEEVLSNAKCILVVPNLIKGGFIIGGKHGRGVATCRTDAGWSAPAFVSVGRRKLGTSDRSRRRGFGYAGHERSGFPASALQQ